MTSVVESAQLALHARMAIACAAAAPAFSLASFAVWETADFLAVRATVPALGFLTTLTVPEGADPAALDAALDDARWGGSCPRLITSSQPDADVLQSLANRGYVAAGTRPLTIRVPHVERTPGNDPGHGLVAGPVRDEHLDQAITVLLGGYGAGSDVARFIAAEHRDPRVRLLAVREGDRPIAVAAISCHGRIAVLGGASTLPGERGRGAQAMLLRARLALAAERGCTLAVATATRDSPSLRNLIRAGFDVHDQPTFALAGSASNGEEVASAR